MEKDWCFVKGGTGRSTMREWRRLDFFAYGGPNRGLILGDSRRIGLGFSLVGRCSLPLKEQGHCMRVEIDASDPGFGLILGDSGQDSGSAWTGCGFVLGWRA